MRKFIMILMIVASAQALGYDITVRWEAPAYDVAGTPITGPLLYQVYGRRDGGQYRPAGGLIDTTEFTMTGYEAGCYELYVTAKFEDSAESEPSNSVEHCTDDAVEPANDDSQESKGEPLPPAMLDIRSERGNDWRQWRWGR